MSVKELSSRPEGIRRTRPLIAPLGFDITGNLIRSGWGRYRRTVVGIVRSGFDYGTSR